mmetsp:Transcript_17654/g.16889  ORF Transcript_17654/g.16889 Transcript_17654/m.16889 type:complete len:219 (-) Transcript_17654:380-1036(-)
MGILLLVAAEPGDVLADGREQWHWIERALLVLPHIKEEVPQSAIQGGLLEGKLLFLDQDVVHDEVGGGIEALEGGVEEAGVAQVPQASGAEHEVLDLIVRIAPNWMITLAGYLLVWLNFVFVFFLSVLLGSYLDLDLLFVGLLEHLHVGLLDLWLVVIRAVRLQCKFLPHQIPHLLLNHPHEHLQRLLQLSLLPIVHCKPYVIVTRVTPNVQSLGIYR